MPTTSLMPYVCAMAPTFRARGTPSVPTPVMILGPAALGQPCRRVAAGYCFG